MLGAAGSRATASATFQLLGRLASPTPIPFLCIFAMFARSSALLGGSAALAFSTHIIVNANSSVKEPATGIGLLFYFFFVFPFFFFYHSNIRVSKE